MTCIACTDSRHPSALCTWPVVLKRADDLVKLFLCSRTTSYERNSGSSPDHSLERFSERTFTDCRCASASDLEEIVNVVRMTSAQRTVEQ